MSIARVTLDFIDRVKSEKLWRSADSLLGALNS